MTIRWIALLSMALLASASPARAQYYAQTNLVSDQPGVASHVDPNMINAWGLVSTATSPFWISNNGTLTSVLYDGTGTPRPLVVTIPGPPTGVVANVGANFVVRDGAKAGPARFIFATEDGKIAGWNPAVRATDAVVGAATAGAVYKGLAIATTGDFLYATNFHSGNVDVFDRNFALAGSFTDASLPSGYAPFGIQNIGGNLFVTFALQDDAAHDDVAGVGHGYVDEFDAAGNLVRRIASKGRLNSPWGLALAPASFGAFGGALLVGNFGDGKIDAYDLGTARGNGEAIQLGQLHSSDGPPLRIDGLWALRFGNGVTASADDLFFTAGPDQESHGLFGKLTPAPAPQ